MEAEEHFLVNMKAFVELEMIRAGDIEDDGSFGQREKQRNLEWFLNEAYPERKIIYWEGRGANSEMPVSESDVFPIRISFLEQDLP